MKIGVIGKAVAPDRLSDEAVAWTALRLPNCYPAYVSAKRALQATTMAESRSQRGSIEIGYRVPCQILRAYARTRKKVPLLPQLQT